MEVIKRNCFRRMIDGNENEAQVFVAAMKEIEDEVRKCYEQPINGMAMNSDEFAEMMVLDGCFIVLLFHSDHYLLGNFRKMKNGTEEEILSDLLLFENQLPFFVLSELYCMIKKSNGKTDEFLRSVLSKFSSHEVLPGPKIGLPTEFPEPKDIEHLQGLVYSSWVPSGRKRHDAGAEETAIESQDQSWWKFIRCGGKKKRKDWEFIRCATELEEAGIDFVKIESKDKNGEEVRDKKRKDKSGEEEQEKASLFDIDFTDGKLKIPALRVQDNTERLLRSLMAYEQFLHREPVYVCDYVMLMDTLINSGKDVQLLCKAKIIDNWLGDHEVVANMFNKLGDFISYDSGSFYYNEEFVKVDNHCREKCYEWKAKLNKDYFNSPWSIISVVAAIVLLLLTMIQTIFSVVSYVHPR